MMKNLVTLRSFLQTTAGATGAMIAAKEIVLRPEGLPSALTAQGPAQSQAEGSRVRGNRLKR